ncbi:MAG: DUF4982 domain-containing protein [Paludibacter sp.]|nr:DUF4982 domain-containing protein [Paludibacter sp.]
MIRISLKSAVLPTLLFLLYSSLFAANNPFEKQLFNAKWQFSLVSNEYAASADSLAPSKTTFDASSWRTLNLPHDWAIEGEFSKANNLRTGGLPDAGTGWYRKHFVVDKKAAGKRIIVQFDGAMNNAHVWVNGKFVGNRPYGCIGFQFDITEFIQFGVSNLIAVRVNPEKLSSRWYAGAGIYRNTWISFKNNVHFDEWGTSITTPLVSNQNATVKVSFQNINFSKNASKYSLKTAIVDASGKTIATATGSLKDSVKLVVANPHRWDIESPYLYTCINTIIYKGKIIDSQKIEFGIRTIEFTPNNGFKLNGKELKLQGVCMHHDLGPLGAAENYSARLRQMQIMKAMGANALRTSHNPPSPEWMQICDKLGFVVIAEAFDEWQMAKVDNGYHKYFDAWHERDLQDMIRIHRNHPSIIMWSIGNEILEQNNPNGWKVAKMLSDISHKTDNTRPTTIGFNYYPEPFVNKLAYQVDVVGMNYKPSFYAEIKQNNPNMILYGSETSSQTSSRGVYHLPISPFERHETNQVSSYDAIVGPPWAYPPEVEFDAIKKVPASLGEFIWTGIDYLGEPTPYAGWDNKTNGSWNSDWPSRSSYFAPVDLAGFPKDRFYLYQGQWTKTPMIHILPHWNWQGSGFDTIPVFAYTNCDEAELFLNGKSLGKKVKGVDFTMIPAEYSGFKFGLYKSYHRFSWQVPYQPGELKVVGYKNGNIVSEKAIKTAGIPAKIELIPERTEITADGLDLAYITVKVVDENGNICPLATNLIQFSINGNAEIAGVENGDPTAVTSYRAKERAAFNGLCQVIVKSKTKNIIEIIAKNPDLKSGTTKLTAK